MVTENRGPQRKRSLSGFLSSGRLPWVVLLLAWLLLVFLTAAALWVMRASTLRDQQRALHTLAVVASDELERGLDGVEEGLTAIGNSIEEDGMPGTEAEVSAKLRRRVELMPMAQTLWLLDPHGKGVGRSDTIGFPDAGGFWPALKPDASEGLAFSAPFSDPGAARPLVAIAMPVDTARYGWVVAGVPTDVLLGAFQAALPEEEAQMLVYRRDGTLLASTQGTSRSTGRPSRLVEQIPIEPYGLQVELLRSRDVVLHDWRISVQIAGALLALLAAVMAVALWILQRAQLRHVRAQQALQRQQARGERLEALGRMAGEVAHDFNNVLGAIAGYGEMALDKAEPGSAQARQLDRLMGATARGRALTERILAFSRGGARRSIVFVLQPVVEEVLEHVRSLQQPGITLDAQLQAPAACVRGDPLQAYQAVLNLCVNAVQAMPQGGMLRVLLTQEHVAQARVLSHSQLPAGDWLRLTVADQGQGIDPVSMDHLLEPFYTTRSGEGGTGLGLAVVHGAIVELHGAIDVQSQPGEGACFTLWMPASASERPEQPPVIENVHRNAAPRILVVDDEPELAGLAAGTLGLLGYEAVVETQPLRALDRLRAQPGQFAAVLTDERMPDLPGTELVRSMRGAGGELARLPVILVTGQGGPMLAARAAELGIGPILRKPLDRQELAQALETALHHRVAEP